LSLDEKERADWMWGFERIFRPRHQIFKHKKGAYSDLINKFGRSTSSVWAYGGAHACLSPWLRY